MAKDIDMTSGSVFKLLMKLSIPAICAQIINLLYNIVDRMYIGHIALIGKDALTGVGVCMPIILAISAFAALVSMGGAPRSSIFMGKKDMDSANKVLGNCAVALVIISISLTVAVLFFKEDLLYLLGASVNTFKYANDYISIYALGTLFVQLTLGLNAFITSQGFTNVSMKETVIGAICNIILDPIFIFVLGLNVKGAALATIISQFISMIFVIRFLVSDKTILRLDVKYLKLEKDVIVPCITLGLAPFIMQFSESFVMLSFNTSLAKYGGDIAVGAMTILNSVNQFSMLPIVGLTQGAQPIISYNYGANNLKRVKSCFMVLLACCLIFTSLIWSVCMFAPNLFVSLFTSDVELRVFTINALRVFAFVLWIFGAQMACQQTFIAVNKAAQAIFLALLRKVVLLIPLIYILPNFFSDKVFAVYLAEPVADSIAVTVTVILFVITFKKLLRNSLD